MRGGSGIASKSAAPAALEEAISKATVEALSELHGVVARELTRRINADEASAADIGAAIKFLKDNNITASVEDNDQMRSLKDKLAEREAKRGKLKLVPQAPPELTEEEHDAIIEQASRVA
ncbi:hypothetical protein [Achromobacter deleyi]